MFRIVWAILFIIKYYKDY